MSDTNIIAALYGQRTAVGANLSDTNAFGVLQRSNIEEIEDSWLHDYLSDEGKFCSKEIFWIQLSTLNSNFIDISIPKEFDIAGNEDDEFDDNQIILDPDTQLNSQNLNRANTEVWDDYGMDLFIKKEN